MKHKFLVPLCVLVAMMVVPVSSQNAQNTDTELPIVPTDRGGDINDEGSMLNVLGIDVVAGVVPGGGGCCLKYTQSTDYSGEYAHTAFMDGSDASSGSYLGDHPGIP